MSFNFIFPLFCFSQVKLTNLPWLIATVVVLILQLHRKVYQMLPKCVCGCKKVQVYCQMFQKSILVAKQHKRYRLQKGSVAQLPYNQIYSLLRLFSIFGYIIKITVMKYFGPKNALAKYIWKVLKNLCNEIRSNEIRIR